MIKRKRFRQKGKQKLSKVFQHFGAGDKVAIVSVPGTSLIPPQFRGKAGVIVGSSGRAFIVRFLNGKVVKNITVGAIYLKKLK